MSAMYEFDAQWIPGYPVIYCHKHFELHQHEMHNICIHTNISSIHCVRVLFMRTCGGHYEHWRQCPMATTNTGAANITHTYTPDHEGDLTSDKSDNLLIHSSQESSGPVQGSLSVDISQGYRVLLWWRVKCVTQGDTDYVTHYMAPRSHPGVSHHPITCSAPYIMTLSRVLLLSIHHYHDTITGMGWG